ncbi:MAG: methyltransferase [Deltaproteobacteria bacterium]|nr:methyltransferase [Deltaproteobacteria bacterium]
MIKATLNYSDVSGGRPEFFLYRPPEGTPRRTPRRDAHTVTVHDGREVLAELSLDRQGVALERHDTRVEDFYDVEEVRTRYFPEVEELVRDATGADRVVAFDHNVRCATRAEKGESGAQMPVRFVHNDYTLRSGPQRVRDLMGDEAPELLRHRFAVINAWRPIRGPVLADPLAVCDASSMRPGDFVGTDLRYRDRTGEVYSVTFRPEHRWYFFSQMERHEVMLLKCYDSSEDGRARFTAHSAIDDPGTPADAPARESIEVRALAFFAPA